jgi:hypothetical protein
MRIDVLGIYAVEATEPCHLLELLIRDHVGPVDMSQFTQAVPGQPRSLWQVPWDERVLTADGSNDRCGRFPSKIVADGAPLRLTFFFHYLDLKKPLATPAGEIELQNSEPRPRRLAFLEYESPS